jgi:hypothetical protein
LAICIGNFPHWQAHLAHLRDANLLARVNETTCVTFGVPLRKRKALLSSVVVTADLGDLSGVALNVVSER